MSGNSANPYAVDEARSRAEPTRPAFNRALWAKTARESCALLVSLVVLLFAFAWVYVWLISKIELNALAQFLLGGLKDLERLSGVPFQDVATPAGRIALAFIDPLVHLGVIVWAISRGSDAVSGELERGTLEMLLAQPVSRLSIYLSKAVVAVFGLVLICIALWGGLAIGIMLIVEDTDRVWPAMYVPPTINVFGLGFAMAGVAALVSSLDRYRSRTIGIMGAFYAVAVLLKVIARMAPEWEAVGYASIFWPFEPQRMIANNADAWRLLIEYNTPLILVGMLCYVAGAVIFCRRDLPAPL
ncbi:MAG: ABC transporter permease subunit [Pirellulales bacterium]